MRQKCGGDKIRSQNTQTFRLELFDLKILDTLFDFELVSDLHGLTWD